MATSKYSSKVEHDIVLYKLINILDSSKNDVYPNIVKDERATKLENGMPDIVLTKKNDTEVEIVLEVETAESVNIHQVQKWKSFSDKALYFYLVVPQKMKTEAEELFINNQIIGTVFTYSVNDDGGIEEIEMY